MASSHPRRDTPSVYGRARPLLPGEGSLSRAASVGGDERRTRGSSRRRQRSPPSPRDEVLEEEHVTATATSLSEDERGQQRRSRAREARGSRATEGVPLPGLPTSEVPRASLRFRFLTTAQ